MSKAADAAAAQLAKRYADQLTKEVRYLMLKLLMTQPWNSANNEVLGIALEGLGYRVGRDQVRSELQWLADQRLVSLMPLGSSVIVAELTERGHDVAKGALINPGVEAPEGTA